MISLEFDPFGLVIQVVHDLYPDAIAEVCWREGLHQQHGAWGCTEFGALRPNVPLISLDVSLPVVAAVEVLAHELAHVIAGQEAEHGEAWEKAFKAINEEYTRRVAA